MIQILPFQRRVAAADNGLAEVAEAVVYVVVVGVTCFGLCLVVVIMRGMVAVSSRVVAVVIGGCRVSGLREGVVGLHYCVLSGWGC